MKKLLFTTFLSLSIVPLYSYSDQSTTEKVEVTAKDAKRSVNKGIHRMKEKICMKSDAKCLAEKAKHRAIESKDTIKDKASEVKDDID